MVRRDVAPAQQEIDMLYIAMSNTLLNLKVPTLDKGRRKLLSKIKHF